MNKSERSSAASDTIDSFEFLCDLAVRVPGIKWLHVLDVPSPPRFQNRVEDSRAFEYPVELGADLRKKYGLSFWDGLLASIPDPIQASTAFRAALIHDQSHERLRPLAATGLRHADLQKVMRGLPKDRMLALSSLAILDSGEERHLPMLDFRCPVSDNNLLLVKVAVDVLECGPGAIFDSGGSYHFIGTQLLRVESLLTFLAKALLLGPLVDRRWVAHQIIERACALRIGFSFKYDRPPKVVAIVNP